MTDKENKCYVGLYIAYLSYDNSSGTVPGMQYQGKERVL